MIISRGQFWAGVGIAVLGFLLAIADFVIRWYFETALGKHYDISMLPVLFGCGTIFIGGFIMNPKKAEDAGGFLVRSGVSILQVIPNVFSFGRRAGDQGGTQVGVTANTEPVVVPPHTPIVTAAPEPTPWKPSPSHDPDK